MYKRSSKNRLTRPEYRQLRRDRISQQVERTCGDIALKLEQLHHQVIKPVEQATDAVQSTVGSMADTVQTAKTVIDNVGEHVTKHPWLTVTGSLVAGLGTGLLLTTPEGVNNTNADGFNKLNGSNNLNGFTGYPSTTEPGFLSKQWEKMQGVAVGAGLALVRDLVKTRMPLWADAADQLTQDVTARLGAVQFTSPIIPPGTSAV